MLFHRRMRAPARGSALYVWTPRIVDMLLAMPTWLRLTASEAEELARHMEIRAIAAGAEFIRQDTPRHGDALMLLLDGEVCIEKSAAPQSDGLVVSIAQPGALLGEMGVLNDAPPSATCVASTDIVMAALSRDAIERLVAASPTIAAKLALGIASRLAERLRATSSKLSTLSQVTAAMHPTLDPSAVTAAHRPRR